MSAIYSYAIEPDLQGVATMLFPLLAGVMVHGAQGLQFTMPEQHLISSVWHNMVDDGSQG
jgi:hypothetical protein